MKNLFLKVIKRLFLISLFLFVCLFSAFLFTKSHYEQKITELEQSRVISRQDVYQRLLDISIKKELAKVSFKSSIFIEGLRDQDRFFNYYYNPTMKMPAASVIKLPIMAVCFQLDYEGAIDLNDSYTLKGRDKAGGSGILKATPAGEKFTYLELIKLMIAKSDNSATNILINLVGFERMNEYFKLFGLKDTIVARHILDFKARDRRGKENYISVQDAAYLLKRMYAGNLVSREYCQIMLGFMVDQKVRNRIPRLLPEGTVVANKTGTIRNIFHDCGIVFFDQGAFTICVFTAGKFTTYKQTKDFISNISKICYDYYEESLGSTYGY